MIISSITNKPSKNKRGWKRNITRTILKYTNILIYRLRKSV